MNHSINIGKVKEDATAEAFLICIIRGKWSPLKGAGKDNYIYKIKSKATQKIYNIGIQFSVIGGFIRCDYDFQHIYTRDEWRILSFIDSLISDIITARSLEHERG